MQFCNYVNILLAKHYNITTLTGTGDSAGTNAKVFIKLFGSLGESEEIQLSGQGQEVFRPGEYVVLIPFENFPQP